MGVEVGVATELQLSSLPHPLSKVPVKHSEKETKVLYWGHEYNDRQEGQIQTQGSGSGQGLSTVPNTIPFFFSPTYEIAGALKKCLSLIPTCASPLIKLDRQARKSQYIAWAQRSASPQSLTVLLPSSLILSCSSLFLICQGQLISCSKSSNGFILARQKSNRQGQPSKSAEKQSSSIPSHQGRAAVAATLQLTGSADSSSRLCPWSTALQRQQEQHQSKGSQVLDPLITTSTQHVALGKSPVVLVPSVVDDNSQHTTVSRNHKPDAG